MNVSTFVSRVLAGCLLTIILFPALSYSSVVAMNFTGSINLAPIGGNVKTAFQGTFDYDLNESSQVTNFKVNIGSDDIFINNGIGLYKYKLKLGPLNETFSVSSNRQGVEGAISGHQLNGMWGFFGFDSNEMMNELIESGEISPSVLKFSSLIFTYNKYPGLFGLRPLFAKLDSIHVTAVPLPSGYILMLSGLGLFLMLVVVRHRKSAMHSEQQSISHALI